MRRFGAGLASADPAVPSFPPASAMPSHPLLRLAGDVREVRGFLELHVSAASRIAESNKALRWPRNRSMQQDERIPQIPVMEEASLRRDLVRLVSDFQDPLVVLRPLMVAELAPLRHGRADVPGLEIPERSDVPSVLRVLVTQETRAPARVVALPAFPLRDRRAVDPSAAVLSPSGTRRYNRTAATRIGGTSTTVTGTWTSWPEVVEVGR